MLMMIEAKAVPTHFATTPAAAQSPESQESPLFASLDSFERRPGPVWALGSRA
jgi:hypothetical protein